MFSVSLQKSVAWKIMGLLVGALLFSLVFTMMFPVSMDELHQFRLIFCYGKEHMYLTGNCDWFALNIFNTGLILPIRSYYYMGSVSAIFYYPFYLAFPSPISYRAMGLLYMALQSLILARYFRMRARYVFLGMACFFPYLFLHVADTGITGTQITLLICILFLLKQWAYTLQNKYWLGSALCIFLGVWSKITFLWLLPGIGIIAIAIYKSRQPYLQQKAKQFLQQVIAFALCTMTLFSVLFLSTSAQNSHERPYLELITEGFTKIMHTKEEASTSSTPYTFASIFDPLSVTHKIQKTTSLPIVSPLYALLLLGFTPAFLLWLRRKKSYIPVGEPLTLFGGFLVTTLVILYTQDATNAHHGILATPFLLLSILAVLRLVLKVNDAHMLSAVKIWIGMFVICNILVFGIAARQTTRDHAHESRNVLHKVLSTPTPATQYTTIVASWGISIYQGLFADQRQVLHSIADQSLYFENQKKSIELSDKLQRKVLVVKRNGTRSSITPEIIKKLGLQRCKAVSESATWQLYYEPHPVITKTCAAMQQSHSSTNPLKRLLFKVWLAI